MLDNEELLFDELYEKTKDCGRTQFIKLLMEKARENQELKKKYENAVADYETTMAERNELKKEYEKMLNDYCRLDAYNRTQQKEFIKYLEDESKEIYRDGGLRQNIFRQILQKYKEITGGKHE